MSRIGKPLHGEPLADLVEASEAVGATRSRLAKVERIAEVLRRLAPDEVAAGVAFLSGELRQRQIGVGWAALRDLPAPAAEPSLTVGEVDAAFERIGGLAGPGSQAARREALAELFARATEPEARFLVRLLGGELRQGALEGVMVQALARAAEAQPAAVQRAFMLRGDLAAVAEAVLADGPPALERFRLEVGRPVRPMLARPAKDVGEALERLGEAAIEWKLDGARVQIHRRDDEVRVFTRTLDDVTARVPEIVEATLALPVRSVGARRRGDRAAPRRPTGAVPGDGLALRARAGARRPAEPVRVRRAARGRRGRAGPAGGGAGGAAGASWCPRRSALRARSCRTRPPADEFLEDAIARGHEGVMLKALDQPYAAGSRGTGWLKVKPVHTLDLVVLAAEWGHGRRRGWLSNLHLGARDPSGDGFVMLGKTFKGLTDAMLTWQTEKLLELETSRDDYTVHVRPELVVEIAFDGVQTSTRYPGGVALRFARVLRHRPDKPAAEADTLDAVLGRCVVQVTDSLTSQRPWRDLGQPLVQPLAQFVGLVVALRPALARDDDAGGRHSGQAGEPDQLPGYAHRVRRLWRVNDAALTPRRRGRDRRDRGHLAVPRQVDPRPRDPRRHQQPGQPRRHGGRARRPAAAAVARGARPLAARRVDRGAAARGAAAPAARRGDDVERALRPAGLGAPPREARSSATTRTG